MAATSDKILPLTTEQFLDWHDNSLPTPSMKTFDKIYAIFTANGFSQDDMVDECYAACTLAQRLAITALTK